MKNKDFYVLGLAVAPATWYNKCNDISNEVT